VALHAGSERGSPTELADRIAHLDTTLFDCIEAQLDHEDQRSLLALHAACRAVYGSFAYLEIGSHLGGSLQVLVRDPACRAIVSIDSRPASQPDERGIRFEYPGNSTARMLSALGDVPGAELDRIHTIERSTDDVRPDDVPVRPQLAFVDGEHTNRALRRDARFCDAVMGGVGCLAFHDAGVVWRGLRDYLDELASDGRAFDAYLLPDSVFVIELGGARLLSTEPVAGRAREGFKAYLHALEETEPYRAEYRRLTHRVLRRIERFASDAAAVRHQQRDTRAAP
jgi:hypothetical protein